MTEKIKIALLHWARKVIDQSAGWDEEKTHYAIQKLYELSIVQKMLLEQENQTKICGSSNRHNFLK